MENPSVGDQHLAHSFVPGVHNENGKGMSLQSVLMVSLHTLGFTPKLCICLCSHLRSVLEAG